MKKVHITLVGGQPVPVYIGIKDDGQANTVVLVCSSQSKEEAERIKKQFPKRNIVVRQCHPVDLNEIESVANQLKEDFLEYEKTINLTSGTKLWSLTFFRVFHQLGNTHFVYVDQTNQVTDVLTKESHFGKIDTFRRFELYGSPLTSFRTLDDFDDADFRVMRDIENTRKVNSHEFYLLTCNQVEGSRQTTARGSVLEYSSETQWARICLKTYGGGTYIKEFQSPHLFDLLFHSGWFELKTARELRRNSLIGNIWLNCEFADTEGNPKNEIDIIAELGNRLVFVECKTMIHDTTDIDKFRSALRNFSGTSSTGVFVTNDSPNKNTLSRYEHAMEKCKDNGILTFNFSLWKKDEKTNPTLAELISEQVTTQYKR